MEEVKCNFLTIQPIIQGGTSKCVFACSYSDTDVVFDVVLMVTEMDSENRLLGEVKRNFWTVRPIIKGGTSNNMFWQMAIQMAMFLT